MLNFEYKLRFVEPRLTPLLLPSDFVCSFDLLPHYIVFFYVYSLSKLHKSIILYFLLLTNNSIHIYDLLFLLYEPMDVRSSFLNQFVNIEFFINNVLFSKLVTCIIFFVLNIWFTQTYVHTHIDAHKHKTKRKYI